MVPGKAPRGSLHPAGDGAGLSPLSRFILDKLDRGVVLLDATGAVVDANPVAQKSLAGCSGLAERNGRLMFSDADFDARFVRMLSHARQAGHGRSIAAYLQCDSTPACRVVVAPTNSHGPRGVRYVALIYAPGSRGIAPEVLSELYGLTRAQAAVARKLYGGCTAEEAASQLRLSLNTVRSHLKQIYARCDVQSQAELLHLLATGPQVL